MARGQRGAMSMIVDVLGVDRRRRDQGAMLLQGLALPVGGRTDGDEEYYKLGTVFLLKCDFSMFHLLAGKHIMGSIPSQQD